MKNKTTYFGVFTSLALILSYVETLIPISWESEYDSLQYGRGYFQSRHHGVAS